MKFSVAFLLLALATVAFGDHHEPTVEEQWVEYKVKFEKKYDDHAEDARRFEIFKNKLHEFEEHNEKFKKGELSWSVGVNQFTDLTEEEFAKMNHGLKVPEKH